MAKNMIFALVALNLMAVVFYSNQALGADHYRVVLKNGEVMEALHYEYQGDSVILYKHGGSFTFDRSEVARIEKDSTGGNEPADKPEPPVKKTKQPVKSPKDSRESQRAACRLQLELNQSSMESACAKAANARVTPAPNIPRANQTTVSEKTAKEFQAHVKSSQDAAKADSSCNYYKRKVAELEKKCSEL